MRKYLVDLRSKAGFSQRRVARDSGLSYQHYARLESGERGGKVSFLTMGRIAEVFSVSLDSLYPLEKEYQESLELKLERRKWNKH